MLFNSVQFFIFFVVVTTLYFIIPHKYRWFLLLVSSFYFYMSFVPIYVLILVFTIIIDYFVSVNFERTKGKKKRRLLLIGLFANILVLAFFKYYNFLNDNLTVLLYGIGFKNPIPSLSIILPIGLSFFTFQAMSYLIDVYRGRHQAERHFGIFALYSMFYPQLVSGPIERPKHLLPQFHEKHRFEYHNAIEGLKLMLWGLFQKVVIADRLAIYVNAVYNNAEYHSGASLALATVFFAIQVYCDFSGYSNLAIGAARVMGFRLTNNFSTPYLSKSISEFWDRWHISLSHWLRDYIYLPMVTSTTRRMKKRRYLRIRREFIIYSVAMLVTFITSGIWHGAAWTFVMLGVTHGFYLVFAMITKGIRTKAMTAIGLDRVPPLKSFIQIITTFLLCNFAYIFFRSNEFSDAILIINKIFSFSGPLFFENPSTMIYSFLGIIIVLIVDIKEMYFKDKIALFNNNNWIVRNISYAMVIILILMIGAFGGGQFIYFQF